MFSVCKTKYTTKRTKQNNDTWHARRRLTEWTLTLTYALQSFTCMVSWTYNRGVPVKICQRHILTVHELFLMILYLAESNFHQLFLEALKSRWFFQRHRFRSCQLGFIWGCRYPLLRRQWWIFLNAYTSSVETTVSFEHQC